MAQLPGPRPSITSHTVSCPCPGAAGPQARPLRQKLASFSSHVNTERIKRPASTEEPSVLEPDQ